MSNATIREAVEAVEAQLQAAPDLGLTLGIGLGSPTTMPQQRGALAMFVRRELTRNLNEVRNQDTSRVEDHIVVELQARVQPKDQRTTRGALYDAEAAVLNRVTELTFQRRWNLVHIDTREVVRNGEWLAITVRFSLKRFEEVGQG